MPLATVDAQGLRFYYEDSGIPVVASDYTTIVLVHGAAINCGQLTLTCLCIHH